MPRPQGTERIEEAHVLEQIRVEPEARRDSEHGDDEEYESHNSHSEEQSDQPQHAHTQVPDSLPQHKRPQWEEHNSNDNDQRTHSIQLLLPLRALVQPDIVVVVISFLVLLNLDVPEALDVLLLAVVVALVSRRVALDLGDAERKERERKELECVLGRGAVGDFREEGVLGASFLVGGGLEGANSTLDCITASAGARGHDMRAADL